MGSSVTYLLARYMWLGEMFLSQLSQCSLVALSIALVGFVAKTVLLLLECREFLRPPSFGEGAGFVERNVGLDNLLDDLGE